MNTTPSMAGATPHAHTTVNLWRIHYYEALNEWRRIRRMPMFTLPSLLFPWLFYSFFGIIFSHDKPQAATYLLASYGTFGVIGPALFGFGVSVVVDRERHLLTLKRALPMPISAYFCAKIAMCLMFALIILIGMGLLAGFAGGVSLPVSQWLGLGGVLLIGTLPFCAMGLAIGLWVNAQAAPAVTNLIYLPLAFLSGLWVPIKFLPELLQHSAWALPPYHLSQLALGTIGLSQGFSPLWHLATLIVFTVVFLALASAGYRRISDR